jgi:predicted O-methyltransferase YrrM
MSVGGTARYRTATHIPPLVVRAVVLANEWGFEHSCIPEQGRLLRVLAAGRAGGRIGETGTGCGVGLAWLVSGADAATTFVSVERDANLAERTGALFAEHPNVTVVCGDWSDVLTHAPFDLLVLDGGGAAKHGDAIDPAIALAPGGTLVIDDFTPAAVWPPTVEGTPDAARLHWFEHPLVSAAEIRTTPTSATIVASRRW